MTISRTEQEIRDKIRWAETEIEIHAQEEPRSYDTAIRLSGLLNVMSALYWVLGERVPRRREFLTGEVEP